MKALKARKRYDDEQLQLRRDAERKAEEEKIAAMSEEERAVYLKEKKERQMKAVEALRMLRLIGGPYSNV